MRARTPCGDCQLCCQSTSVASLAPGEEQIYASEIHLGQLVIAKKTNGDCVYLNESGCSIHEDAPLACRKFDCAAMVKLKVRVGDEIYRRGKELLRQGHKPQLKKVAA